MSIIKQKELKPGETWESRAAKRVDAEIGAYHWLMKGVIGFGVLLVLFLLAVLIFS